MRPTLAGLRAWRPRSFRSQIVVSTMLLMAAMVVAVGLLLQLLLNWTANREVDSELTRSTQSVIAEVGHSDRDGVEVSGDRLDPGEAVYDTTGRLVAGSVEVRGQATAAELAAAGQTRSVEVGDDLRLRAQPFTTATGVSGVVVVSAELEPYERSEHYAVLGTALLGLLAVGLTGLIARRVTSQALGPVRLMAETASEWSETDLARRFALGAPTNEITALGETLDHLLERVARAIRSEQRLTSELAHELRTPLTAIQGSADLVLLRGGLEEDNRTDLEQIGESARRMAETITTLLELARELGDASHDSCSVGEVVAGVRDLVPTHLTLDDAAAASSAIRVGAPAALAVRALAPLVDNAARFATTRVCLTVRSEPGETALVVTDDGPGIAPEVAAHLFEPGTSGSGGTGLGLAIARRVARSFGGDVVLGAGPDGGVELRLPTA